MTACEFSATGDLLIATGHAGIQAIDVLTGARRGEPATRGNGGLDFAVGPGGLVALASDTGTTLWEPVTALVQLPSVSPDSLDGDRPARHRRRRRRAGRRDRRAFDGRRRSRSGCSRDWGSGKSFLIRQVQERVRGSARGRARQDDGGALRRTCATSSSTPGTSPTRTCGRASRRTSSTQLARARAVGDGETGSRDDAAAQLARLEQQIGRSSTRDERLERGRTRRPSASRPRRQLAKWTCGLSTRRDRRRDARAAQGRPARGCVLLLRVVAGGRGARARGRRRRSSSACSASTRVHARPRGAVARGGRRRSPPALKQLSTLLDRAGAGDTDRRRPRRPTSRPAQATGARGPAAGGDRRPRASASPPGPLRRPAERLPATTAPNWVPLSRIHDDFVRNE